MKNFDVVTVGNALLDLILHIQENNIYTSLNKDNQTLCFRFGEKIHVEECHFLPGGNACNAAVGLARLGLKTALMAEIGNDEFSEKILNNLSKEPVDLSLLLQTNTASSFSVGINYQGERTLFVEHVKRKHDFQFTDLKTKWIYLTSLGEEWKEIYKRALTYVKSSKCKLAFSPGTHQYEEENLSGIKEILPYTDILFVNKEEGVRISNIKDQKSNIGELLVKLREMGPKVVSTTDGTNGSYSIDANGEIKNQGIFETKIVGRTGAGDAYASGFLASLILEHNINEAMRWGALNAAAVIGELGAQTGLLTREEMEKK